MVSKIKEKLNNYNTKLATILSKILANMWFFWLCIVIDVIELVKQPPTDVQEWCNFLSQTVIQLLALSVLALCNDISTNKILKYLEDIWKWLKLVLSELKDLLILLKESHDEIKIMHTELLEKLDKLQNG